MSRWLSVSALVYAGWVVYACTLGLALRALDPDIAEFGPAQFFVVGSVTAALLAPMTGFFIVRAINPASGVRATTRGGGGARTGSRSR